MKGQHTWTTTLVAKYIEEAMLTLRMLPLDTLQQYINAWPGIIYGPNTSPFRESKFAKLLVTPDAISRLDQALTWMRCVDSVERRLLWRRASNIPVKIICEEFRRDRTTLWRKWIAALGKISKHLNMQHLATF